MATWSDVLGELQESGQPPDCDGVRRKHMASLYTNTGRNVIFYASGWLQKQSLNVADFSISDEDMVGLMEVNYGMSGDQLDLILHSPGGSVEAAESIVAYLRARFSHIRVFVPHLAMSAATMIACAADEVILGKHSFLGPTDPQIIVPFQGGRKMIPAQNVLDQFELAKKQASDPKKLAAWMPMLEQYGPDLLVTCQAALDMSKELVAQWLDDWMLRGCQDARTKAHEISDWLSNQSHHKSHLRHIGFDELQSKGIRITRLEDDPTLQDLVLSAFHATMHTFSMTHAIKIIENQAGRAYIRQVAPRPATPPLDVQVEIAPPQGAKADNAPHPL